MASWDSVPHLTKEQKDDLYASIPPHQREARTRGIPVIGSGAIYPLSEREVKIDDFEIPAHWPRCYGMDVGWNWTVATWYAQDPNSQICYLYSGHYQGHAEPSVHAEAVKARGAWIPGVIDPGACGRSQTDGSQLLTAYRALGLNLTMAKNAVEAGILKVWQMLVSGTLKVFASVAKWFEEFRNYRRDLKGNIVKVNDHMMDSTRYWALSGLELMALPEAPAQRVTETVFSRGTSSFGGWMG